MAAFTGGHFYPETRHAQTQNGMSSPSNEESTSGADGCWGFGAGAVGAAARRSPRGLKLVRSIRRTGRSGRTGAKLQRLTDDFRRIAFDTVLTSVYLRVLRRLNISLGPLAEILLGNFSLTAKRPPRCATPYLLCGCRHDRVAAGRCEREVADCGAAFRRGGFPGSRPACRAREE